jgi:hypothetical protein
MIRPLVKKIDDDIPLLREVLNTYDERSTFV